MVDYAVKGGIEMEKFIVRTDSPNIPADALLSELHMDGAGRKQKVLKEIAAMHEEAMKIAKPTALYAVFTPEARDGSIYINGIELKEKFVYEKLAECSKVIPYVATCGVELEEWSQSFSEVFQQFIADAVKQLCVRYSRDELLKTVQSKYFDAETILSTINPGSLETWPIQGQKPLFAILGGVTEDIGVVLKDTMLMIPTKSVSGIIFQTDSPYHNCQLCPRIDCPGRKAPYEDD